MKKHISLIAALLLPLGIAAQNINPEVQVTNEYETRINDAEKQGPSMTVPDSMLRFDYHFDYSVFESPYKGAYEFSPYAVNLTPAAGGYDGRKLYLRAGAGWTLRPELDLVWSALDRKRAAVNVFAKGEGYYGNFLKVADYTFEADRNVMSGGYDFRTVAGVDTRFNVGKSVLRAEVAYDGIFLDHYSRRYGIAHAPYASVRIGRDNARGFSYSVGAQYRYVNDRFEGWGPIEDHDVKVDASVSPYIGEGTRGAMDLKFAYNGYFLGVEARPHLFLSVGPWDFDAGLRAGWSTDDFCYVAGSGAYPYGNSFTISPDVKITVHLIDNHLDIYAGAVGGNDMLSYWDYRTLTHSYVFTLADPRPVWEIADCFGGVRGFTGFGLRGDLKAGYRFIDNAPLWTVSAAGTETVTYNYLEIFHADLDLGWKNDRVDVEGAFHYNWLPAGVLDGVFSPAEIRANLSASYNWMKRIYAGISGDMSTKRVAVIGETTAELPLYVNLGVWAEYKFNNRFGVWLKGSNLLNHEIRLSPVLCPFGPSVTAGISLSL